jgi:hypothetical protein
MIRMSLLNQAFETAGSLIVIFLLACFAFAGVKKK